MEPWAGNTPLRQQGQKIALPLMVCLITTTSVCVYASTVNRLCTQGVTCWSSCTINIRTPNNNNNYMYGAMSVLLSVYLLYHISVDFDAHPYGDNKHRLLSCHCNQPANSSTPHLGVSATFCSLNTLEANDPAWGYNWDSELWNGADNSPAWKFHSPAKPRSPSFFFL